MMRKFLIQIGIFLLLVLILATGADCMISSGLRKTDIRKFAAWNDIYNEVNMDNDLVVLGASCAWCAYNTYVMDSMLHISTFNLGVDGHSFPMYKIRYDAYRRHARAPKYIIINLDIATFNHAGPYEREQLFPYFNDRELVRATEEAKNYTLMDQFCPLWRYIGYRDVFEQGFRAFFGAKEFPDGGLHKGFRGNTYPWDEASLKDNLQVSCETNADVIDAFCDFIREKQSEGIEVILVRTPLYYRLQPNITNKEESLAVHDSIAKECNVQLLDYWLDEMVMDTAYFCNSTHLNKCGAELFSTKLCKRLINENEWNRN